MLDVAIYNERLQHTINLYYIYFAALPCKFISKITSNQIKYGERRRVDHKFSIAMPIFCTPKLKHLKLHSDPTK